MARRAITGLSAPLRSTARGIYDMWRLGFSKSQLSTAEQTSRQQITSLLGVPSTVHQNGLQGLIDIDADEATREWLKSKFSEI